MRAQAATRLDSDARGRRAARRALLLLRLSPLLVFARAGRRWRLAEARDVAPLRAAKATAGGAPPDDEDGAEAPLRAMLAEIRAMLLERMYLLYEFREVRRVAAEALRLPPRRLRGARAPRRCRRR